MSSMGELTFFLGLQVKQKPDGIFISQDKYVAEILKKFTLVSVKTASTPIETQKPLVKDEEASDVDVHLYRSMIGSLMYVTASRPDIMFAVCACSRFQVTPKTSHLSAVKRIFRYLKGKPKLGLWYPRVSSFDLESYSDSDYAGANLDRKSTTGGCQFLGRRLITWQCKKQTIVATSTTEAEYVAAASCCGQVLWIQNQIGSSVDERGKTHHGKTNLFQETPKPLCSTFLPTDVKHCLNVGYTFVNFATSEAVWKSHVCITRKSWPLFKSKKIAQVVRAWIQSKNSLVKHFEDMRLYRPSKEYLQVGRFNPPRSMSMSCLTTKGMRNNGAKCARRFRESLRRVTDGAEAFLILTLFILCLDKVSTDHAKLVPLGKVCTAKETLEKNTAKGTKCKLEPLISLTDDLSLLSNMAALESCPKHNSHTWKRLKGMLSFMKSLIFFGEVIFIMRSLHITAKVAGKFVSISEASIRTDLIFDDADGIDSLPNQAIFDAIQLMGYEGDLTDEGASSERLSDEQPSPSPAPTSEVPNESLPDSSSAQPSEVPFEQQPDPSPRPSPRPSPKLPSPTPIIPDSNPEPTGENLGDHSSNDTSLSGNEIKPRKLNTLRLEITKLKKQAKPVIKHHKAYLKSLSLQQRFPRKSFSKKHRVHKESVSKQGRKKAKGESSVQRNPLFDVLPEDKIDHMETENAQSEGRTREMVDETRV
ncbi:uncharacterized mitochondrial protein-like protein [Tanacetum coccineum]